MKEIPLTQGKVALVDDEDYERATQHKWYAHRKGRTFYACRNFVGLDGRRGTHLLHNFILGALRVDHRDGNGLNDLRDNIRAATQQQNMFSHRRKRAGATSKYRGVYWDESRKLWKARITISRRLKSLGRFTSEEDAARAYDAAAIKFFGEFAAPNFPA